MLLLILRCLLKCLQTSKPPPAAAKSTCFSTVHSHPASRSRSFHKFTLQMWPYQPCVKLMSASRAATPSWYCRLMSDIIATTEVHVSARTQVWAFFQSCCDTASKTGGLGEWWKEWVNCSIFWCTTHQSKTGLQGGLIERLHIHPATDSTETAEFMKFTMTRGAAKPETWCCTKTAAWGCYIYPWFPNIVLSPGDGRIWTEGNQIRSVINAPKEVLRFYSYTPAMSESKQVIQQCTITLLNRTHLLFKGGYFSYHWLCSASWCDAPWRPWWCHSGKRRALMERSHWPSSSCCTPDIDKTSNEKLEMAKQKKNIKNCMTSVNTYMATMASPRAVVAVTTGFLMFLFMWPEWDF